jgi:hypothetical protein
VQPGRGVEPRQSLRRRQALETPVAPRRRTTAPFFCSTHAWSFLR